MLITAVKTDRMYSWSEVHAAVEHRWRWARERGLSQVGLLRVVGLCRVPGTPFDFEWRCLSGNRIAIRDAGRFWTVWTITFELDTREAYPEELTTQF